jgi:predicted metal-binding transcription factor (methanogenesis marker protein 9)
LKKLEDVDKLFNESYMTPKTKKLLEDLLRKSVHNVDDLDYLNKLFIDDDFFKCISEMEDTPKAIRGMAKHLDEVKKSTAFSTLTNEIQKITSS